MILLITADKFLKYAKRIISRSSPSEEESRSAISRAYYSLYHHTLETMIRRYSLDLIKRIERSKRKRLKWYERSQLNSLDSNFLRRFNFHKILPDTLVDINEPILAISFKNFRDSRNQADYDLKRTFTHLDATTLVSHIDNLVSQVDSI